MQLTTLIISGKPALMRPSLPLKNAWVSAFLILLAALSDASTEIEAKKPGTDSLDKLADDFWTWRAKHAPFTGDDVNR
ncbi:MAG TPA: hypothetical protein DCO65_00875, partial [Spartobacteria bacterium]|nr:hypothetical protein [Spartobacteria bacterium]